VPEQNAIQVILASQSPRRLELLRQIGIEPFIIPADIDEAVEASESALEYVKRMAVEKARAIAVFQDAQPQDQNSDVRAVILAADTIVLKGNEIFGKPNDKNDFMRMMNLLSDSTHQVLTAVSCLTGDDQETVVSTTEVKFCALDAALIEKYWRSGEPSDKAGGYAIQGLAAVFIEKISGSYSGVMGLPLFETSALISNAFACMYQMWAMLTKSLVRPVESIRCCKKDKESLCRS